MYETDNSFWLLPLFVICGIWFAVQSIRYKGKTNLKTVVPWFAAVTVLVLIIWFAEGNSRKLRTELQGVDANEVKTLTLSQGNRRRQISSPDDIAELILSLQSIKGVHAHHSHPINKVHLRFIYHGKALNYTIGHDSENPGEFWVDRTRHEKDERGVTVVQGDCDGLGAVLDALLDKTDAN